MAASGPHRSRVQALLLRLQALVGERVEPGRGVAGRLYVAAYFAYKRLKDRAALQVVRSLVEPGTAFVDVGAHLGFFALAAARAKDVRVLAFEPAPATFVQLERVLRARGARAVQPFALALSDRTGTALLHLSDLTPADHKLVDSRSSRAIEVATSTLDDFLAARPALDSARISLVKVDVQGAELAVLRGMQRTLARHGHPPVLVEYAPADLAAAGATAAEFFAAFADQGYRPCSVPDLVERPQAWFDAAARGAYTDLVMLRTGR